MSYGSTFVQFDPNGKLSSRLSRSQYRKGETDRSHKLIQYEKEFDVSLSRVSGSSPDRSSVRDSMIAYSNKMKSLQDSRNSSGNSQNDPLFVRAKHIPKHPAKAPKKRRPMSFDELLGRDRESKRDRNNANKQRPLSDKQKPLRDGKNDNELHLPLLTERLRNTGPSVQVSLVSASDLYELVDFSLRSKNSRAENLQMMNLNFDADVPTRKQNKPNDKFLEPVISRDAYERYERTQGSPRSYPVELGDPSYDSLVPSHSYYERIFSLDREKPATIPVESSKPYSKLPAINNDIFKRRPNRVKRMKLQDSQLGDIPEDNVIEIEETTKGSNLETGRRVVSPPPHRRSPKSGEIICKPSLDAIMEQSEKTYGSSGVESKTYPDYEDSKFSVNGDTNRGREERQVYRSILPMVDDVKTTKKVLIRDDGDVRIEVTQCPPKQEHLNAKLKAQKRFKKLIFLRDGSR